MIHVSAMRYIDLFTSCILRGKARLRVADSDWSKKFSLDTVGCSGTILCKSKSREYEVSQWVIVTICRHFPDCCIKSS